MFLNGTNDKHELPSLLAKSLKINILEVMIELAEFENLEVKSL